MADDDGGQPELPLPFPERAQDLPLLPARMVNEYQYCPRLSCLEGVQEERLHAHSITLSSNRLGLIAKMDLIESDAGAVLPVDYKRGKRPHVPRGAYEPERVQLCVQGMVLEEHGYTCAEGAARPQVRVFS